MVARFHKIVPCLWFDHEAEAAANFYVSVFPNSRIITVTRYGEAGFQFHQKPRGSVMTVEFDLDGQPFTALNGGPQFQFSEAISLQIMCETQAEIDRFWAGLTANGGKEGPCGWLTDRFGLSWQVVPTIMTEMMTDANPERLERVLNAMFQMGKLDIAALQRAYAGE